MKLYDYTLKETLRGENLLIIVIDLGDDDLIVRWMSIRRISFSSVRTFACALSSLTLFVKCSLINKIIFKNLFLLFSGRFSNTLSSPSGSDLRNFTSDFLPSWSAIYNENSDIDCDGICFGTGGVDVCGECNGNNWDHLD